MTTAATASPIETTRAAARQLRVTMAAARVSFTWFGVRKSLTAEQKTQVADTFGAEGNFLSAGKKLLDTAHPAFKRVTAARHQISAYWRGMSLPYPEPGIRLIRQDEITTFTHHLASLRGDLLGAVDELDEHFGELKSLARQRLGTLFNSADYPASLTGMFDCSWEFPSVEPPEYLRQLSPQLYEQEAARVAARFDEAIELAEQAFIDELGRLIAHLTERLSGHEDGKPRIFRDTAIGNLTDFFQRFRHLNVRSSEQLETLVQQAQQIVGGVRPQELRDNRTLRQQVAARLSRVGSVLDGLLVDRPRRNILRRKE